MTRYFKLNIELGNAAFDDGNEHAEVARILRELAQRMDYNEKDFYALSDVNGNRVGAAEF